MALRSGNGVIARFGPAESLRSLMCSGGAYGEDWHETGYKATKPNTWQDAISSAEWLIANKYTSPAKLKGVQH